MTKSAASSPGRTAAEKLWEVRPAPDGAELARYVGAEKEIYVPERIGSRRSGSPSGIALGCGRKKGAPFRLERGALSSLRCVAQSSISSFTVKNSS